jgi:hypothetical protein
MSPELREALRDIRRRPLTSALNVALILLVAVETMVFWAALS